MPLIKIARKKEFMNLWRNYRINIDGVDVGTIANGQTKEFEVDRGYHRIKAKIDWCGSQELLFEIRDGEIRHFEVAGFKPSKWLLPGFFMLMFYITINRNRYLSLTQKS